jgi:hypothetical protein
LFPHTAVTNTKKFRIILKLADEKILNYVIIITQPSDRRDKAVAVLTITTVTFHFSITRVARTWFVAERKPILT